MRHPDNQDPNYKAGRALAALAGYEKAEVVDEFIARVVFKIPNSPFLIHAAGGTPGMLSPTATRAQAIMLTVLAMNLPGDGLRDVLDPRLKV